MAAPKRRASGEGSVTKNARGLWVARVELPPTYGPDGLPKRRRIEKASTSQRTVLDWLADRKADLARYGTERDGRTTVAEWSARWLAIRQPHVKPATMHIYRSTLRTWVLPVIGAKKLAKLRPADVRAVTDGMREAGKAAVTMTNAHAMVSAMLAGAMRDGLIIDNPAKRVQPPRVDRVTSRGAFTVEQVGALLAAEASAGACRFTVQLLTGMRQAETLGLTWGAVDFEAQAITVLWQLQAVRREHGCGKAARAGFPCGYLTPARCPKANFALPDDMPHIHLERRYFLIPPKSGKVRTVPMLPTVAEALRRHGDVTARCPNPHDLVFRRDDGVPLRPADDQHAWRTLLAEAGLPPGPTTHWARHTVATLMMQAGVDAKIIAEIVGHSTERITRETYQHTTSALARDGMRRFGELIAAPR